MYILSTYNKTNLMFMIAVVFFALVCIHFCDPDPVKANDETALRLVQCIRSECNDCSKHQNEPAAISHVLYKRMQQYNRSSVKHRTLEKQILLYCAVFDKRSRFYYSDRSKLIRNSTFLKPLLGKLSWWNKMHRWAKRFTRNPISIKDPTPSAMHYGGRMDDHRAHRNNWRLVATFSNRFWAMR